MSLKEDIELLQSLKSDIETIKLYTDLYNGDEDDIPESWYEKQFEESIDLKYNNTPINS